MYKLFLVVRYLRKQRIVFFAVAAVALSVVQVLVQRSVMGGWLVQVKQRARGLLGDVIMDNRALAGFPLYEEFIAAVSQWPEIVRATPVLYSYGLLRIESPYYERTATVGLVGIRLREAIEVNAFGDSLFYEKYFPGTTTLDEQRKPLWGFDVHAPPHVAPDGAILPRVVLPEPYQSALERARRAHAERGTGALDAPDAVDSDLNRELRAFGFPPIPGEWAQNRDADDLGPALEGDPWPGLILGRDLVARRQSDGRYDRHFTRGTIVKLTYWAVSSRGQVDPLPKKQTFRYADDSRTGVYEIDSKTVYCDFDLLQKLLEMNAAERVDADGNVIGRVPARCSQVQIKVRDGLDAAALHALTARLRDAYHALLTRPGVDLDESERRLVRQIDALTWEQSQAHIIGPVERELMMVTIILGVMSLSALALILCILYMVVLRKTRDIGIVKAIGGSSAGVGFVFVLYGAAVGLVGGALGLVSGTLIVSHLNDVQDFLIRLDPALRVWDQQVYSFDRIPSEVNPLEAAVIVGAALLASIVGSLAAAWRAGAMQPVEAIRYE